MTGRRFLGDAIPAMTQRLAGADDTVFFKALATCPARPDAATVQEILAAMPLPKFIYFDLGKVIVHFDLDIMCRQMGSVAGVNPELVFKALFDGRLQDRYESGEIDGREFYEAFCKQAACRPDYEALELAGSDIFTLNAGIIPVIAQLRAAGYRLGVLSNTCQSHWDHCMRRFSILRDLFSVYALSYRIRAAKPDPTIFRAAADLAGGEPEEIFYTDDNAGHIAGAKTAGFDAVQYTSTPELVAELHARGISFNY